MDKERILREVAADLFGYLMSGELTRDEVSAAIRPESLDSRYDDYESLVDLHFVLSSPVLSFVERLPQRLRELKTETRAEYEEAQGSIRGRIDWGKTYQRRSSQGNVNQALYVCSRREESRATAENRLLRYVVEIIADTLRGAESFFESDVGWVDETWEGDRDLRRQFLRLYETNVHLQALEAPAPETITDRMIRQAETARQPLYRQAAMLYQRHERRRNGDEEFLRKLIADTTVLPEDADRRFELYVLFRTIRALASVSNSDPTLRPLIGTHSLHSLVPGRSGPAATFDGQREFNVFFDQSGSTLDISFRVEPERSPGEFSRSDAATVYGDRASTALFGRSGSARTKRPDVLIAPNHPSGDPAANYVVMEVKHSTKESTIKQGVQELTRYLAFMRRGGNPVFEQPGYQGRGINGLLVVQDLDTEIRPLKEQADLPITVLQASELESQLPEILEELLGRSV